MLFLLHAKHSKNFYSRYFSNLNKKKLFAELADHVINELKKVDTFLH